MKPLMFFMGLTIGALAVEVVNQREKTDLALKAECAYHEGESAGYNTGKYEKLIVKVRNLPDGAQEIVPSIMEDDPRWDCKTMGNKFCGKGHK